MKDFSRKNIFIKKELKIVIVVFLLFSVLIPFFIFSKPADAIAIIPVPLPITTIPGVDVRTSKSILQRIWDGISKAVREAADVAFKNSMRVFFGKLAEDTAVWLASAGTGQKPLFLTNPGDYFEDLAQAAGGDFLYTMGRETFGIDVCEPDLSAKLSITFALGKTINPDTWCQDSCQWSYNKSKNMVEQKYTGKGPQEEGMSEIFRTYGTLEYFQKFDTQGRWPEFENMHKDTGTFKCPIKCINNNTPPPGNICNAEYFDNTDDSDWREVNLSRENLQACISTLQNLYYSELKQAQKNQSACLVNCHKGRRKERCQAQDVFKNFNDLKNEISNLEVGNLVEVYFQPEQNDIGQLLTMYGILQEKTQAELDRERMLYEKSIGPVTTKVSREILTPKELVEFRGELAVEKSSTPEEVRTGSFVADIIRIFTNTLVNRVIDRFYGGKCALNPNACKAPTGGSKLSQIVFGGGPSGIAAAKLQFASISRLNYTRGSPGQDPVSSPDLTSKGIIDSGMQTAIDQRLTVKEAIDKGLIGGTFGFEATGREPDLDTGIPFRSILYLKKYRVVPVGWELAAKWIRDNPQNITLEQLTEEYTKCESGASKFCSDDDKKSCIGNSDCYNNVAYPECVDNPECNGLGFDVCVQEADGGRKACYFACDPTDPGDPCVLAGDECRPTGGGGGYCVGADVPICQSDTNASPFCGLVEPGWVLKMPDTYCEKRGATEEIITKEFVCDEDTNDDKIVDCTETGGDIGHWLIVRNSESCVDEVACLIEDSEGKCKKYGYCYEERPAWRFNGDECSRQYASCQSYIDPDGAVVSYLRKTVDFNACDATNAGCRWYCQEPDYDAGSDTWLCTKDTGSKIHFDRDVKICQESELGCQWYTRTTNSSNLLKNSSLEYFEGGEIDDPAAPAKFLGVSQVGDMAFPSVCGADAYAVTDSYTGSVAARVVWLGACGAPDSAHYFSMGRIDTGHSILNRTFTISMYAKASAACTTSMKAKNMGVDQVDYGLTEINLSTSWQRFSRTFTVNEIATPAKPEDSRLLLFMFYAEPGCDIFVDGAQLEEGGLSEYKDYGAINNIYLNGNRVECTENDVGCEKYTPVEGGIPVPGVVYEQNLCTADKVGCQAFRESPIENIPKRPGRDPLYFVGSSGDECSASSLGCEEYTNLDIVAQGGEGKEYFSKIRQCVKPGSPDVETYYTWVGSDTTGYQLRAFRLKVSNLNDYKAEDSIAPCTNLSVPVAAAQPVCIDDLVDPLPADCDPADMAINPDCAEFFDTDAKVFYRLMSRVIKETEECFPHRNTIDALEGKDNIYYITPSESMSCSSSDAGCREYKGNTGSVTRTVFEDGFENVDVGAINWISGDISNEALRANEHSLRISTGNTATNTDASNNVLKKGNFIGCTSTECNIPYYQLSFWLKPDKATQLNSIQISNGATTRDFTSGAVTLNQDWNLYTFGPLLWDANVNENEALAIFANGSFFLDNVLLEEVSDVVYRIKNSYTTCSASEVGCKEYKDRAGQSHYIKSFDHLCSEKFIGCEALINTQNSTNPFVEYFPDPPPFDEIETPEDVVETIVNDTTKYCKAEIRGCQRFGLPILNQLDDVSGWQETQYFINDPDKYEFINEEGIDQSIVCRVAEEGCAEFQYLDGEGTDWFKDPRAKTCEYTKPLDQDNFDWYKTGTKLRCPYVQPPLEGRPVGRACVKKCVGGLYNGQSCVDDIDCVGGACAGDGKSVGTACTTDDDCLPFNLICDYWAGLCPEEESGCNEYRDPSDPDPCRTNCPLEEVGTDPLPVDENCEPTICNGGSRDGLNCFNDSDCSGGTCSAVGVPGCRSYYYIRQSVEENRAECGNTINSEEGCLPFNDTSNPVLNMRGR